MQIDLFDEVGIKTQSNRMNRQIETRKFELQYPIDEIKNHLPIIDNDVSSSIIDRLTNLSNCGRLYTTVGEASCDSHWELELLGLGEYTKEWIHVIDLSECLDLLFYIMFGVDCETCRVHENYLELSKSLLNFEFEALSCPFSSLLFDSDILTEGCMALYAEVEDSADFYSLTVEEQAARVVYTFYSKILTCASEVKSYIMAKLKNSYDSSLVFRSKTFSLAIGTSDNEFQEELFVSFKDVKDYKIPISSYRRYDGSREVLRYELRRNGDNRVH